MKVDEENIADVLRRMADASATLIHLSASISEFCVEKYGYDPSDINCVDYIESCLYGGSPLTAEEFHNAMLAAIGGLDHDR